MSKPKADPERSYKLLNACKILGMGCIQYDLVDAGRNVPMGEIPPLYLDNYDHLVCHNKVAEYGHPGHLQVYNYIHNNYSASKPITYFGYGLPKTDITTFYNLTDDELSMKMSALRSYNHIHNGKPYCENLIKWIQEMPGYKLDFESFAGDTFI